MTGRHWRDSADDRFGPRSTSWNKVESMRDYIQAGAQSSSGFYMGALGLMTVLALLGRAQQGAYVSLLVV